MHLDSAALVAATSMPPAPAACGCARGGPGLAGSAAGRCRGFDSTSRRKAMATRQRRPTIPRRAAPPPAITRRGGDRGHPASRPVHFSRASSVGNSRIRDQGRQAPTSRARPRREAASRGGIRPRVKIPTAAPASAGVCGRSTVLQGNGRRGTRRLQAVLQRARAPKAVEIRWYKIDDAGSGGVLGPPRTPRGVTPKMHDIKSPAFESTGPPCRLSSRATRRPRSC